MGSGLIAREHVAACFQFFGALVASVPCGGEKYVALTLDDGPTPEGTAALLPLLDAWRARATFFVEGRALDRFPGAGHQLVHAGHELGNHSYSHRRMLLRSAALIRHEVELTDAAIVAAGYSGSIVFRAPFGKKLAYSGHRDHPDRRIVIRAIGHRDRSEATLAGPVTCSSPSPWWPAGFGGSDPLA